MNDLTNPAAGVAAGKPADLSRQAGGDRPAPCGNPAHTTGAAQAASYPGAAGCEPRRSPPGQGGGGGVTSPAAADPAPAPLGTPDRRHGAEGDISPVGAPPPQADGQTYVPVRAMEDVLALRHQQIHKHGHTPEADALKPLKWFAEDLLDRAKATHEGIRFNKGNAVARLRLVKIAALAMAMIDRIDSEETEA